MGDDEVDGFVPTSLKDLTRDRWLNEMIGPLLHAQPDAWFVMVADAVAQTMIGGSCKIADLNRRRIALLESLERERFPFPGLDAIYVIQPEASSVDKIIADWDEDGEDPYNNIHIYFLSPCDKKLLDRIANMRMCEKIVTCKEINIMFQPVDSHGFSLGMDPDHYATMFGRGMRPENVKNWKTLMVDSIVSICTSLGEKPKNVRYWNAPPKSLVKDVAEAVRTAIDEQPLQLPASETTVLILDRSFDMVTPFMDHWCWGHIILENFDIDISKAAEWGLFMTEEGEAKMVDEEDYAFQQLRFMVYPVAKKSFGGLGNENSEAYPAAAKMQEMGGFGKLADDDPLKKNALKELVQYKDNDAEIKFHVGLARKLRSTENTIEDLIQFMQSCAMMDTSAFKDEKVDGKMDTWKKLCQILEGRQKFTQIQRDKALLSYIAGMGNMGNNETEYLHKFDRADSTDYCALLKKMEEGFGTGKNKRKKEKPAPKNRDITDFRLVEQIEKYSMDSWVYPEVMEAKGQIEEKGKIYQRWTPRIRRIIEGILDKEDHILKDTKLCGPGEAPKEEKKKPEAKGKKKRGVGVEASGDQETIEGLHGWRNRYQGKKFIPGKVVIFVIGGVCHAELQAAYELVSKYDLDVYIGGTAMMTGKGFVEAVRHIKAE